MIIPRNSVTPVNFCWAITFPYFLCLAFCSNYVSVMKISPRIWGWNLRMEWCVGTYKLGSYTLTLFKKPCYPKLWFFWQFWTSSRPPLNPSDFKTLEEISRASAIVVDWAVLRQCCASLAASCETSRLVGPTRVLRYRVRTWGTICVDTSVWRR